MGPIVRERADLFTNHSSSYFKGYDRDGIFRGGLSISFNPKSGLGFCEFSWDRALPNATSFEIEFHIDPVNSKKRQVFLKDEGFKVSRHVGDNHCSLWYEIDSQHPHICRLTEIRIEKDRLEHRPFTTPATITEYTEANQEEMDQVLELLTRERFPTEIDWLKTLIDSFKHPRNFAQNYDQPFRRPEYQRDETVKDIFRDLKRALE